MKILVINGPNINMLGVRQPKVYGNQTYEDLLSCLNQWALDFNVEIDSFQSNYEGAIVDKIQSAIGVYDGIIINPAAYTHTSVAIADAILAVNIKTVEVHLTDISKREDFRKISFVKDACIKQIAGYGFDGYKMAIEVFCNKEENPLVSNVIRAGIELVDEGLIARTWGNVSQRIDDNHYYITPSGRDYTSLGQNDIVKMRISDDFIYSNGKPSSEYKIHKEIYRKFKDVNFVIHTHQDYGSAMSLLGLDQVKIKSKLMGLGQNILFADYGLPGSDKLAKSVAKALKRARGNAIILKNHGVVCFGKNYEEAFVAAKELELVAKQVLISRGITEQVMHKLPSAYVNVDNEGRYFIWDNTEIAMKVANLESKLNPYIDDFAQIVGIEISTDPVKGILCQSDSLEDLEAIYMIVNKNCLSYLASRTSKTGKAISKKDSLLMRENYINNYSKLK